MFNQFLPTCCFIGLNRYTFPYCIFSNSPSPTRVISSRVVCLALKPICSAKQIAGKYGFFLHTLYAFLAFVTVNRFSCAIKTPAKDMYARYIYLLNHVSKIKENVYRYAKHVSKSIRYICNVLGMMYIQNICEMKR